ncbi:MAG TPA: sulfite oxidase, partial [Solirubrobacteraceae bacterium]|nr:sulfite oxidase [Solirubrobacteraceae bacterium]
MSIVIIENVSRRDLLKLAAAGTLPLVAPRAAWAQAAPPILKPLPPEWFVVHGTNAEMRWESVRDRLIANERFFVRNHTRTPSIDRATWRLTVHGTGVRRPLRLSLRDLERLPSRSLTAIVECAGNGRSFFGSQQGTPASGTPWKLGGIGAARWRGVPLAEVLDRAGLRRAAVDVLAEGLDDPYVTGGVDYGRVRRPIPIAKALDDVLLAYEMNGRDLPADHGAPLRLVVPGWIGITSIKWLGRLEVSDAPIETAWNTKWYPGLGVQPVKSAFELAWDAEIPAYRRTTLTGRSWSGNAPIRRVEVSTDGGAHWTRARLHGPNERYGWVRWELPFKPRPGRHELLARATDRSGLTQP